MGRRWLGSSTASAEFATEDAEAREREKTFVCEHTAAMATKYTTWNIDEEVKIRMTESGAAARPAISAPQAFQNTLAKYGSANALQQTLKIRMTESGAAARPAISAPQAFQNTLAKFGSANALHFKKDGEWTSYSFQTYYDKCCQFAKGLLHVGLERYQGVSIIGFNSPEWAIADIGAIFAGGVAAGIYTTNNPKACEFIAKHSDSAVVVCDGVKQLEKFLAIQDNLPKLKALVMWNDVVPEGIQSKVPIYTFEDFLELGKDVK
ncbi:Long-chain-fatty-acid-CoA ligase, partial [Phytophthora palmivora]